MGLVSSALTLSTTGCSNDAEAAAETKAASPLAPAGPVAFDPRESLAPMIEAVRPSVVAVDVQRRGGGWGRREGNGLGSGFVIDDAGLVVTNHHVVDGAGAVRVRLSDGRRFDAEVVGSDPATDLAVLRLPGAEGLTAATLGESRSLQVGDWVVAMGSPMGLDTSASVGIVSGKGRGSLGLHHDSIIDFLQTDADIAPGSSGGPLFDLRGKVVGINTAVGESLGPGFAIPIDQAKRVVEQLRDHGTVARGWLGAGSAGAHEGPGARIDSVYADTPAERAGLRPGDVVEAVDGEALTSFEALRAQVGTKQPGDEIELRIRRDGEIFEPRVTLGARPERASLEQLRPSSGRTPPDSSSSSRFRWPWDADDSDGADIEGADDVAPEGPRLGILARSTAEGLEVTEVREDSLAETLGLRPGDRLRELNGVPLHDPADVAHALATAGSSLTLRFERDGAAHVVTFDREGNL